MPFTVRRSFGFSSGVKFLTSVIVYVGALPWILPSARSVSPSCLNASLRIAIRRLVSDLSDATVKSNATKTLLRETFARFNALRTAFVVDFHMPFGALSFSPRSTTTYVRPGTRFFAGWMIRLRDAFVVALASSSPQTIARVPVCSSSSSSGCLRSR